MSGTDLGKFVERIDTDIEKNRKRLLLDIQEYVRGHKKKLVEELLSSGRVTIPTFAGEIFLTEQDLVRAARPQVEDEAA